MTEKLKKQRDYVTAEKLNLKLIKNFIEKEIGCKILQIFQPWRHITAVAEKDGEKLFFKMGSTQDISFRTKNECDWYQKISQRLRSQNLPFEVPKIFQLGLYNNELFWYLSSYFNDNFLATKNPPDKKNLEQWFLRIVKTLNFIGQQRNLSLWRDKEKLKEKRQLQMYEKAYEASLKLAQNYESKVSGLLKILEDNRSWKKTMPAHGDFVPWHMLELNNEKFGLIDAEHATEYQLLYYDAAYFFRRIYVLVFDPKLAKEFLRLFYQSLPLKSQKTFVDDILPSLAYFGIWNYEDNKSSGIDDFSLCDKFRDEVIHKNFL